MENKIKKYKKVINYVFFGGLSAGLEFVIFVILKNYFDVYIASVLSFGAGMISSFLFNKLMVFGKRGKDSREVIYFFALGAINSQISSIGTSMLSVVIPKNIAKIIFMVMVAAWNYLIMNYVIFRKRGNI